MIRAFRLAMMLACAMGPLVDAGRAHAQDPPIGITDAWARPAPMMPGHAMPGTGSTGTGAVYLVIRNQGPALDALVGATTDAAKTVEIHETKQEGGMMMMRPVARLEVPAGAAVELKPGGHHLMLLDLTRELKAGDTVRLRLTFEKAGELTVNVAVR